MATGPVDGVAPPGPGGGHPALRRVGVHLAALFGRRHRQIERAGGERRDAERGGLRGRCDVERSAEHVGLQLHEQRGGGGAAVGVDRCQRTGRETVDGGDDVADLVGDGLEGSQRDVPGRRRAGDAGPQRDGATVEPGGGQAGERGNEGEPAATADGAGQCVESSDVAAGQDPSHRLEGGPAGDDVALVGVDGDVGLPGEGAGDDRLRERGGGLGAGDGHHDRRAGPVGDLALARAAGAVQVERGMRVGQDGDDGDPRGHGQPLAGDAEAGVGGDDGGQHRAGDAEPDQQFGAVVERGEVEQQGARRVARLRQELAGETVDEPRVEGAEPQPGDAAVAVEEPAQLGGREHRVERESGDVGRDPGEVGLRRIVTSTSFA